MRTGFKNNKLVGSFARCHAQVCHSRWVFQAVTNLIRLRGDDADKIREYAMTSCKKRFPVLTKEHVYLIYAEGRGNVVSFALINCWIDTKLETVWKSLIVYNMLCACAVSREGSRCIHGVWEN